MKHLFAAAVRPSTEHHKRKFSYDYGAVGRFGPITAVGRQIRAGFRALGMAVTCEGGVSGALGVVGLGS